MRLTMKSEKWTDQPDTSLGQRKTLSARQESNPYRDGGAGGAGGALASPLLSQNKY